MNTPTWIDGLRLFVVISMGYGAWQGWKNRPPRVKVEGKTYYRLTDGRFSSLWGLYVKDPALNARIAAAFAERDAAASPPQ